MSDRGDRAEEAALLLVASSAPRRLEALDEALRDEHARPGLDWPRLVELAERHGLLPLLHHRLAESGIEAPETVRRDLAERCRVSAGRTLAWTGRLAKICGELRRADIPVVPFKGPTLALAAWPEFALRPFRDLDLLVAPADLDVARAVLEAAGYLADPAVDPADPERYHLTCSDPGGAVIELHWALSPSYYPIGLDAAELTPHLRSIRHGSLELSALEPDVMLLVACVHGGRHLWRHLLWLADVGGLLARHGRAIDWRRLDALARRSGTRRLLGSGLALAAEVLGAPLPADARPLAAAARGISRHLEEYLFTPPSPRRRHDLRLRLRERLRDRIPYLQRLLRRRAFPHRT